MQRLISMFLITTTLSFPPFIDTATAMDVPSFTAVTEEDLNASHTATPLLAIKKEGEPNALAFMDIEKKNSHPAGSLKRSIEQIKKDEKETILGQKNPVAKKQKISSSSDGLSESNICQDSISPELIQLKEKAGKNDPQAQFEMGQCYLFGKGVDKDLNQAVEWYRKAAENNYAAAQYNLGQCYLFGKGVDKDLNQAVEWYRKAAENNHAAAQYNLGQCYLFGKGVDKDLNQAVEWYRKAAEQNHAAAQYSLGWCYDHSIGVERDPREAVEWYRKAAEQNYAEAQYNLGICYAYGKGVEQDPKEAVEWYRKATEQNHAAAQYSLGWCYDHSKGVEQDLKEAVEWYRKAAEQNHAAAQYSLGWCYDHSIGVDKDLNQAFEWYRKAAEKNYAEAQYALGVCYEDGKGIDKDLNQAVEWYGKAAEQKHAEAQYALGVCYEDGKGVDKDLNQAFEWYEKAAEQDHAAAQYALGVCYEDGKGIDKDLNQAVEWYRKAAEQNYEDAQQYLNKILGPLQNGGTLDLNTREQVKNLKRLNNELIKENGFYAGLNKAGFKDTIDNHEMHALHNKMLGFGSLVLKIISALKQPGFMVRFTDDLSKFNYSTNNNSSSLRCYPQLRNLACFGEKNVKIGDLLYSMLYEEDASPHVSFSQIQKMLKDRGNIAVQALNNLKAEAEKVDTLLKAYTPLLANKETPESHQQEILELAQQYGIQKDTISTHLHNSQFQEENSKIINKKVIKLLQEKIFLEKGIKEQLSTTMFWEKQITDVIKLRVQLVEILVQSVPARNQYLKEKYPWLK
ncbi:tetratricopeptide repeat protein [Candidatus Odyssella acanthamoebae]|uniref:tetratricopeptide repeat protein n=1 Tax=Candidatus Odyssella acanthamoebae TaxID=91604 RepID=UPI00068AA1C2|nr:SEL1-like repeat protein [Candidatus Paracaedibacter acanthamoebae]